MVTSITAEGISTSKFTLNDEDAVAIISDLEGATDLTHKLVSAGAVSTYVTQKVLQVTSGGNGSSISDVNMITKAPMGTLKLGDVGPFPFIGKLKNITHCKGGVFSPSSGYITCSHDATTSLGNAVRCDILERGVLFNYLGPANKITSATLFYELLYPRPISHVILHVEQVATDCVPNEIIITVNNTSYTVDLTMAEGYGGGYHTVTYTLPDGPVIVTDPLAFHISNMSSGSTYGLGVDVLFSDIGAATFVINSGIDVNMSNKDGVINQYRTNTPISVNTATLENDHWYTLMFNSVTNLPELHVFTPTVVTPNQPDRNAYPLKALSLEHLGYGTVTSTYQAGNVYGLYQGHDGVSGGQTTVHIKTFTSPISIRKIDYQVNSVALSDIDFAEIIETTLECRLEDDSVITLSTQGPNPALPKKVVKHNRPSTQTVYTGTGGRYALDVSVVVEDYTELKIKQFTITSTSTSVTINQQNSSLWNLKVGINVPWFDTTLKKWNDDTSRFFIGYLSKSSLSGNILFSPSAINSFGDIYPTGYNTLLASEIRDVLNPFFVMQDLIPITNDDASIVKVLSPSVLQIACNNTPHLRLKRL